MFVFFSLSVPLLDIAPPVKDVPAVIFTPLHSNCMPLLTLNTRIPLPVILVLAPSARMTRFLEIVIGFAPMSIVCPANTALIFTVSPGAAQLIAAGRLPVPVPDVWLTSNWQPIRPQIFNPHEFNTPPSWLDTSCILSVHVPCAFCPSNTLNSASGLYVNPLIGGHGQLLLGASSSKLILKLSSLPQG